MVGNVWAIFSQVAHSEEAQPVLQEGTVKTDREIKRMVKNGGMLRKRYRLRSFEEDGVVAFDSFEDDNSGGEP